MKPAIFVSYSHADRKKLEELQTHLKPIVRNDRVHLWDDTRIAPGADWKGDIERALEEASAAILLVSPGFLASEFIANNELPVLLNAAEDRGLKILPVFIEPSSYGENPGLSKWQGVNDPKKPLNTLTRGERQQIWVKLADTVKALVPPDTEAGSPPKDRTVEAEPEYVMEIRALIKNTLKNKDIEIGRTIDTTGSNVIFEATDNVLNRKITIKTLDVIHHRHSLKEFFEGMKVASLIKHKNVVTIHEGVLVKSKKGRNREDPLANLETAFLITEYISGPSMRNVLKKCGAQPLCRVKECMIDLADALSHAHLQGFKGHNFRPKNILINILGHPMLTAFRLTEVVEYHERIDSTYFMYNPPERDRDGKRQPEKTSQFRLGLIGYEMLQGKEYLDLPAGLDNWQEVEIGEIIELQREFLRTLKSPGARCPGDLWSILKRMLSVNPDDRYPNLQFVIQELAALTDEKLYPPELVGEPLIDTNTLASCHSSYRRCRAMPHFFEHFYIQLFALHPDAERMFSRHGTIEDRENQRLKEAQYHMLREAIELMLSHPREPESHLLQNIAFTHKHSFALKDAYYGYFKQAFLKTVEELDPFIQDSRKGDAILKAWSDVLDLCIKEMC